MDDEPRSVRVEVKDASTSIVGGLDAAARTDDSPRWPLIVLGAALMLIIAGLFLLSPDTDQAADGTERIAPTTSTVLPEPEAAEDLGDGPEAPTVRIDASLAAIPVDVPVPLNRVIEIETGFLGVPVAQPAQEVVFLESTDALTWTIVDMASNSDRFEELGELFVASIAVATDGTELFGGQGSWIPASVITPLRLGGVAFVSGGARQDWSIVTVDADSGRLGAFAIPFDTEEISEATLLDVAVLGETREFADRSPHLLIDVRGQLWSLNTQWGEWTQIFDPSDLDAEGEAGPFQLSSDGDRVYQPTADGLRMIELGEDDDGVLRGQIRSAPLGPPEWFSSVRAIEISTILAASNNKLLFYNDQQLWLVEPPPPLDGDS